jgi:hypothetical protein
MLDINEHLMAFARQDMMTDTRTVVNPQPFDHKSKMRLIEHGPDWTRVDGAEKDTWDKILLQSVATGYLKWWPRKWIFPKT